MGKEKKEDERACKQVMMMMLCDDEEEDDVVGTRIVFVVEHSCTYICIIIPYIPII